MHFKVLRSHQDFKFNVFPIKKKQRVVSFQPTAAYWPLVAEAASGQTWIHPNTQLMSLKVVFFSEPTNLSAEVSERHAGLPKSDFTP